MQVGEYAVTPSDENELIEFLSFNDFTHNAAMDNNPSNNEYVIVVNVVNRFYFIADRFFVYPRLTQVEFFKKINHYPKDGIEHKRLLDDEGRILYEGYVINDHPYGLGRLYFDNGNVYQEGVFDIKGIRLGKEHYCSGQVKFEGSWGINKGYGPNAPRKGSVYNEGGERTFAGKFEIIKSGVGLPMIKYPTGYRLIEENRPKIDYIKGDEMPERDMNDEIFDMICELDSCSISELCRLRDETVEMIRDENITKNECENYHRYLSSICDVIYLKMRN